MPPKKTKSKVTKKISKKTTSKISKENQKVKKSDFYELMEKSFVFDNTPDIELVKKGQYKQAFELLEDAEACQLTPILIGPPGTGKTLLARSFASSRKKNFEWMTLDESTKPGHFVGAFDPGETLKRGFIKESFLPGSLTEMMVTGGIFLANELNRATEYTQNTFLEPLEERSIMLPRLGRIRAHDDFFLMCAANPGDMAGTHRLSEALKDRIKIWIKLDYPSRSVEMEIIHANIPQTKLSKDYIDLTYNLIDATRKSREIERPASIRSAIAITKLAAKKQLKKKLDINEFKKIAGLVLIGGLKPRPGFQSEQIVKKIINTVVK
ncbi:AAA family ATPase [Promethearchaeum syntrophicum]|uniref:AAA family ATPase n=1 Tax=Promethearchaeum syntrophicum TaxID=2594042 RepID=A0A5B9DEC7_9ARCH|nr:MoxR family ATPase [Candidatus Prometheoarchaeum syntrophicum]QEE17375.1 AAA domain (dynein-related subfamily) [Candidatus Prometheoarchaeum syntrophicum]